VVQYRWHPLYGQRVRRIRGERRASGELVHVELTPGAAVAILPAWKLDAVYCAADHDEILPLITAISWHS